MCGPGKDPWGTEEHTQIFPGISSWNGNQTSRVHTQGIHVRLDTSMIYSLTVSPEYSMLRENDTETGVRRWKEPTLMDIGWDYI